MSSNEKIDLIGGRFAIALRTGDAKDGALVACPLFHTTETLNASDAFLEGRDRLDHPCDHCNRPAILCTSFGSVSQKHVWTLTDGRQCERIELRDALVVDDTGNACRLARPDAGIARIADV